MAIVERSALLLNQLGYYPQGWERTVDQQPEQLLQPLCRMCVCAMLREKAAGMGPGERLSVDREWIEWALDEHPCGCAGAADSSDSAPRSALGYTVPELAEMFDWGLSTTRARLAAGVFGDPETLKPVPPEWHVPPEQVEELRRKLARGYQIGPDGLIDPSESRKATPSGSDDQETAPQAETTPSGSPKVRKRKPRRSAGRRHNGWREMVEKSN